ncbi:hypothetical protein HJA_16171 [Hyphomonas jannaschiana VP2]|uniref:Uncharacterized protein n=1 Tax=Hyphomonas jannaschiana VP2 TaxID=1280952 RepID=A0A059F785_9PROT|nr:hypothetical protein HJA_16171 [Hyphomonas jannaschiana VP2]
MPGSCTDNRDLSGWTVLTLHFIKDGILTSPSILFLGSNGDAETALPISRARSAPGETGFRVM